MMFDREEILQKPLTLPPDDRAYVATALEESLILSGRAQQTCEGKTTPRDANDNIDLASELSRRSAAFRSGATTARPADEVLADMERREAAEHSA